MKQLGIKKEKIKDKKENIFAFKWFCILSDLLSADFSWIANILSHFSVMH